MKKILLLLLIIILLPINVLAVTREEWNKALAETSNNAATNYSNEFAYSFKWGGSPSNPVDKSSTLNLWLKSAQQGIKTRNGYIYASKKSEAGINGSFQDRFPVFCETFVKLMVYHASGGKVSYPSDFDTIKVNELKRGDLIHFNNHIAIYLDDGNDSSNYTWNVVEASSTVHTKVISNTPDKGYRIKDSALAKLDYNTVISSYDFHDRLDDYNPVIESIKEIEGTNRIKIIGTDYKHYDLPDKNDFLEPENNGIIAYQVSKNNEIPTTNWKTINKVEKLNIEVEVEGNGTYYIFIKDVGGNVTSKQVNLTNIVIDKEIPSLGNVSFESKESSVIVTITDAKDNNGIKEYRYYLNNKLVYSSNTNIYEIKNLSNNELYNFYYEVVDNSNNINKSQNYEISPIVDAKSIELSKEKIYLVKNETYKIEPKIIIDTNNYKINYKSSNDSICTVTDGLVKGINPGSCEITVSVGKTKAILSVKVSSIQIVFNVSELPIAYIGKEYKFVMETTPNSEISLIDSKLPDGLYISNNTIMGTPKENTSGIYEINLLAKTGDSESVSKYFLTVKYNIEFDPLELPKATIDKEYNELIKTNYPVTLKLKEGTLPKGINLIDNKIVGTPKEKGIYKFIITASYMNSTGEIEYTLEVRESNLLFYILIVIIMIVTIILIYQLLSLKKNTKKLHH